MSTNIRIDFAEHFDQDQVESDQLQKMPIYMMQKTDHSFQVKNNYFAHGDIIGHFYTIQ